MRKFILIMFFSLFLVSLVHAENVCNIIPVCNRTYTITINETSFEISFYQGPFSGGGECAGKAYVQQTVPYSEETAIYNFIQIERIVDVPGLGSFYQTNNNCLIFITITDYIFTLVPVTTVD